MPNITPRHHDEPPRPTQGNPQTLTLSLDTIKQVNGLYCLNDLHRLAGGHKKDTPSRFIRLEKTQALITSFEKIHNPLMGSDFQTPKMGSDNSPVLKVVNGGAMQGIYGSKGVVYAYTSWLNSDFHAMVYTVFERVATGEITYTIRANMADKEIGNIKAYLSGIASDLCVLGKQVLPALVKQRQSLHNEMQISLPLTGSNQ